MNSKLTSEKLFTSSIEITVLFKYSWRKMKREGKKKVLFVCIHNTCRSVIAETIFNSMAKKCRAESAGIEKAEKIDETAVRLLKEKGFEVTKNKPRTLNEVNLAF